MRGAVTGTGADLDIKTVGFRPRSVHLINTDSADEMTWHHLMADGYGLKRVAAGTGSVVTTAGITPLAAGFRLGADADLNVAGETVLWEATE
jgi:hypothetical protein